MSLFYMLKRTLNWNASCEKIVWSEDGLILYQLANLEPKADFRGSVVFIWMTETCDFVPECTNSTRQPLSKLCFFHGKWFHMVSRFSMWESFEEVSTVTKYAFYLFRTQAWKSHTPVDWLSFDMANRSCDLLFWVYVCVPLEKICFIRNI